MKKMKIQIFLAFVLFVIFANCEKFRFDNYTVYRIYPENVDQINILKELQNDVRFDFWTDPVPNAEFVQVMASPSDKSDLFKILDANKMRAEVTMNNVQEHIDKQTVKRYTRNNIRSMTWDSYYNLDDINAWLDDLISTYPTVVSEIIGGWTYEGRDIKGVRISHGAGRRAIFIEGGIHAREWISPSAVCYIIEQLLISNDPETVAAARDYDWYIFPVTNPDGYIWTHESFRMWRKNRRPVGQTFGVDLNRNWNNNWLVAGASSNPNSDSYAGSGPFSEPETRSLSTFISSIGNQIDLYLSFHSFSQMLLLPFGNTTDHLDNYYDAVNIGRRAMGALSVRYETQYVTGNIAEVIYMASGGSVDWVKGHLHVPLVYCYELRDTGTFGFLLPSEQILPNNLETMDSVLDIIHQAKRFGYMNSGNGVTASVVVFFGLVLAYFL